MNTLNKVKEFHEIFGHPVHDVPTLDNPKTNTLRIQLLQEELNELCEALIAKDTVEVLDALTDLQYVLDGAYLALGFHKYKKAAFNEVHNSNLSKLDEHGKPIIREDGKILKGNNFVEPDFREILNQEVTTNKKETDFALFIQTERDLAKIQENQKSYINPNS